MSPLLDYQQKMINLFIKQERTIAEMYHLMSGLFPQHKDFFLSVHKEELMHAQWLEQLSKKAVAGNVIFHEDKTRTYTVQAFLDYLNKSLDQVKSGLPLREAMSIAMGAEEALLERKILDHFDGDSPVMMDTLKKLRDESGLHLKKLKDFWARIKEAR